MLRLPDGSHVPYAPLVGSTLKMLYRFENDPLYAPGNRGDGYWPNDPLSARKPKRPDPNWVELEELFRKDPEGIVRAVETGRVQWRKDPTCQLPSSVVCATNYEFRKLDIVGAQDFWALICSPSNAAENTAPWALHNLLKNMYKDRERVGERVGVAFVRKAWAGYRDPSELVRRMRFAGTDSFPGLAG
jgi:hypothetical protein